jgi:aspartate oxidase
MEKYSERKHKMNNRHEVIIVGSGLSALATAARLYEQGIRDIAIYATAYGGTPYIAAINFVLEDNPYGDTPAQYAKDMMTAGYEINNSKIVNEMCAATKQGYELLKRWNVKFATEADGSLKRRHASGSTYPRSLCCTTRLIGEELIDTLTSGLKAKGVSITLSYECVSVLVKDNRVYGITVKDKSGALQNIYSGIVVAAWGGVGNLFGESTYPYDINGKTIAMAFETGAKLVDMEFLEYEPMVVISPDGAKGEPCPTAMLGEGAHLLNSKGERFIFKTRPQGEPGSPKSLINKAIWHEVEAGRGSPHDGAFVDLRHIPVTTLKAYPWFYNRLINAGVDPSKKFVEVGPMAHSYSGGILIDEGYRSTVGGLYAVGEAAGSLHGACRLAGNAASQATLSGLLCAQAIVEDKEGVAVKEFPIDYVVDGEIYNLYAPQLEALATKSLGIYRNGEALEKAQSTLKTMLAKDDIKKDTATTQKALSILIIVTAALNREESRGTHMRTDYPSQQEIFKREIILQKTITGEIGIQQKVIFPAKVEEDNKTIPL